jgi:hypothetical protein
MSRRGEKTAGHLPFGDARAAVVHVEVHHDGTGCLTAAEVGGEGASADMQVLLPGLAENTALDFVSLAATSMRVVGVRAAAGLRG